VVDHAVLTTFVKPPQQKTNRINFKNFFESARDEIMETFATFDLEPVFLFVNSTIEECERLSEALCTVSMCGTLGTYLGNALEERYDVPYVRTINPMGVAGYETWLRAIGEVTGRSEPVERHIDEQRALYLPQIEQLKEKLKGLRVVLGMGPGYAFEVARVCDELGMEVVHNTTWHFDSNYDDGKVPPAALYLAEKGLDFPMSVSDQQNYELMNVINTLKPDLYLSRHTGTTVWAIKQGVPALCVADEYMIYGHRRVLEFGQAVLDTINNRSFELNLARRTKMPYTDWWYRQKSTRLLREVTA
jgi:nitrogenase molybdenum-iron protein alpha chain